MNGDRAAAKLHIFIELVTIPALPDVGEWDKFNAARIALAPNLSHKHSAERYGVRDLATR